MNEAAECCVQRGAADALTHSLLLAGSGFYASFRTPPSFISIQRAAGFFFC